jgi:hypothetical protein
MNANTTNRDSQMYGCDFQKFLDNVTSSITYKFSGANMIVAGLMSDAQEQMAFGDTEGARQTLNRAKGVLFAVMEGQLNASGVAA